MYKLLNFFTCISGNAWCINLNLYPHAAESPDILNVINHTSISFNMCYNRLISLTHNLIKRISYILIWIRWHEFNKNIISSVYSAYPSIIKFLTHLIMKQNLIALVKLNICSLCGCFLSNRLNKFLNLLRWSITMPTFKMWSSNHVCNSLWLCYLKHLKSFCYISWTIIYPWHYMTMYINDILCIFLIITKQHTIPYTILLLSKP